MTSFTVLPASSLRSPSLSSPWPGGSSPSRPRAAKRRDTPKRGGSLFLSAMAAGLCGFSLRGSRDLCGCRPRVVLAGKDKGEKSEREPRKKVKLAEDIPEGADFYTVLGVDRDASQDEIRAAYKRLIRQTHPDVNPDPSAREVFIQVQEAFRWLSDPQQREVYDGIGSKFGQDAIYDYSDEPILGTLNEIQTIGELRSGIDMVNICRRKITIGQAVKVDLMIKDIRRRYRKYGAMRMTWVRNYFMQELKPILSYPKLIRRLHPFERLSIELSLSLYAQKTGVQFGKLLACMKDLKRQIWEESNARAHAAATAERGRLATFIADQGIEDIYERITNYEPMIQQFRDLQKVFYHTPVVSLDKPTIVFVGAPNVGKSSLVRSLSSGKPQVSDYAFTTKQLTVGHMWHFISGTPLLVQGQIVDSPGMRHPPGKDVDYNLLDQLTLGSMELLPTGVVYVFDPYPIVHGLLDVDEQIDLRESLRRKFPKRPWLDVITRVDIKDPDAQAEIDRLQRRYPESVSVSALEGTGLEELNMEIRRLLEDMTRVVRQLQRTKIRALRMGTQDAGFTNKEALALREA